MSQFPKVNTQWGAPMGRSESPLGEGERSISVFRVKLDSGGYDDGGAYWGCSRGEALYCAACDEGGRQFVRARSRFHALQLLELPAFTLKRQPRAEMVKLRECAKTSAICAQVLAMLEDWGY